MKKTTLKFSQLLVTLLLAIALFGCHQHKNSSELSTASVTETISKSSLAGADDAPGVQNILAQWSNNQRQDIWHPLAHDFRFKFDPNQKAIQHQINEYVANRSYLNKIISNSRPYIYQVYQQARKNHLPADLALVPLVESDYNPFGYAKTGAMGLWQLMGGTASGFGLRINWWYDGRRSITDSTRAALQYLGYLHGEFHDWYLALAAYDSGDGTIQAAIRYNREHGRPTDFWSLPLPQETRAYVPKILALSAIIQNPSRYHMKLPHVVNAPYFVSVKVDRPTTLTTVAKLANTNINTILALNPGYRRFKIPNSTYPLLLPIDKVEIFREHLSNAPDIQLAANTISPSSSMPVKYHVKDGDTLGKIAKHYQIDIDTLKANNHLDTNDIHSGQKLFIPDLNNVMLALNSSFPLATTIKHPTGVITEDTIPGPKPITYTVHKGDSLKTISREYHVRTTDLWFWNRMANKPRPGQQLVIWINPKSHHPSHHEHHEHYLADDSHHNKDSFETA